MIRILAAAVFILTACALAPTVAHANDGNVALVRVSGKLAAQGGEYFLLRPYVQEGAISAAAVLFA